MQVYNWAENQWKQRGSFIGGLIKSDDLGTFASLSPDSTTLVASQRSRYSYYISPLVKGQLTKKIANVSGLMSFLVVCIVVLLTDIHV